MVGIQENLRWDQIGRIGNVFMGINGKRQYQLELMDLVALLALGKRL